MKLKIPTDTRQELYKLSAAVLEEDPEAEGTAELLPTGVAFHHAGLVKSLRRKIEIRRFCRHAPVGPRSLY